MTSRGPERLWVGRGWLCLSETLQRAYGNPSFAFVAMAMVGAWGRHAIWTS